MAKEDLGSNIVDVTVAVGKAIAGYVPIAGPILSEIISLAIPKQRLDRVQVLFREIDDRFEQAELQRLKDNKYFIDLLEDAIRQATRALSEARNKYIAIFLERNKDISEKDHSIKKKLLYTLEQITDDDIEILFELNKKPYDTVAVKYSTSRQTIGAVNGMSDDEKYIYQMKVETWDTHVNSLEKLDLLQAIRQRQNPVPMLNGWPDMSHIDTRTGLAKVERYELTGFAKLLISSISE